MKRVLHEFKLMTKPTPKELWHGTWTTVLIAFVAAVCVSMLDTGVTAILRLFL